MKIKAIEVENIFSYGCGDNKFKIEFNEGNIAVIVGPNNAGKTNLFRVLEFLREVIDESKKHDEMIIEIDKLHSTTLRNIQLYQNNLEKDSYVIVDFELTGKDKKLIENFLRCYFGLDFEFKLDVNNNGDLSKLLDEILELLDRIKTVKPSSEDFNRLERYRLLLKQLILSLYLLKSLSHGKLVWKYNVKSRSLYCPIYYTKIKEFNLIDENTRKKLNKIKNIKEELKNNPKYQEHKEITKIADSIIDILEKSKNKLPKEYLIKLHKHILSFNDYNDDYLLKDFQWGSYSTGRLEFFFDDLWEKEDTLGGYENPKIKLENIWNDSLIGTHELKNYIKNSKSNEISLYDTILSIYYNGIITLMNTIPYPEKKFEIPDYIECNVSKKYEIQGYSQLKHKIKEKSWNKYYGGIIVDLWGDDDSKKLRDKEISIPKIEEYLENIEGLTHNIKYTENYEVSFEVKNIPIISEHNGYGKDLAKYLFYLKNYDWKRFNEIKETLKLIFEQENIYDLDIIINEYKFPEIRIMFRYNKDIKMFPIENVGSGIFEVLNILAVVIGAKEKVILLDEPALHLHPVYQKNLLKVFDGLNKNGNNQIIIITHSPYLVDTELLPNTFRFYKDKENEKTKSIHVGEVVKNLYKDENKIQKKFEENEIKKRLLFANGVLLTEGDCEYYSLPILLEKIGYSPEDYNIEIVNVRGKSGFKEYIEFLNSLKIPFGIVCDGETAFNIYKHNRIKEEKAKKIIKKLNEILDMEGINEDEIKNKIKEIVEKYNTDYELKNENDYSIIINAFKEVFGNEKHPFWLEEREYKEIFNNIIKEMEELRKKLKNNGKEILQTDKEVEFICIEPLYNKFAEILKEKLFIFACKEYDWTEFLGISKNNGVEKCIQKTYKFNDKGKLDDLRKFIKNFINKCTNL